MKGILFNIIEDIISDALGVLVWEDLLDSAGIDHGHTALGSYPDDEAMALVHSAADRLGLTARQTLIWIGERATTHFYRRYPDYFDDCDSARAFLPTLNAIIHPDVRKLLPDARPPSFRCTDVSGTRMDIVYESHRPMCGLAEGLIAGVGTHYRQPLQINHAECVLEGDTRCRFELQFLLPGDSP